MQVKTALTAVLLMVSGATAIATDACEYKQLQEALVIHRRRDYDLTLFVLSRPRMQLPQQLLLQKWLELQVSRRSFGQRARLERKM
ncbi:hypothetical protein E4U23_006252 [Claviceps purpurea]|nr:hypothetical protein E4U23_006252 [Claviceps purpurea]